MYRYYQVGERDAWTPVPAKSADEAEADARKAGATKLTILSVSAIIRDEMNTSDIEAVAYKGPLYFDIDCKTDLSLALESANTLVAKLLKMGMPSQGLELYLSGSKGVHLLIDMAYFSPARAVRHLPLVYAEMARDLYVPGVDFQVYSQGRGNSFRLANLRREDGNYRVPVTRDELATLTVEQYREQVKAPRTNLAFIRPEPVKVPELMAMFDDGKRRVGQKPKQVIIATDAQLALIREEPPQCVQKLCNYEGIKKEVRFNGVAMQLGVYIARSGVSEVIADGLVARLADHGKSDQYGSVRERLNHVRGQVAYMQRRERWQFGCNAMRGLLERRPCEGCPLEYSGGGQQNDDELSAGEAKDGYFIPTKDGRRRITNFILKPCDVFIDIPQDGTSPRRVGTKTDILKSEEKVGHIMIHEDSFNSRSAFLRELTGLPGLTFQGGDNDVQAIKSIFQSEERDVGEIRQVYTAGIHVEHEAGKQTITYVEPGLSISSQKVQGTHQLWHKVAARPYFSEVGMTEPGDTETENTMLNLLAVNDDLTVAALAGWFAAAHFKSHLYFEYRQFPLLNLYGNAGSGKSKTAGLFTWLNGTRYEELDSGVGLPTITPFAALEYVSGTLTVPRVLDEFNKSKIKPQLYDYLTELMKAAWDGNTTMKGHLGRRGEAGRSGAVTVDIPITAPLVILSEQEIDMPALIERSVLLHMRKKGRAGREPQYKLAVRGRMRIQEFGKVLMGIALRTSTESVRETFEVIQETLNDDIETRPRYSAAVLLFGLRLLREAADAELAMPQLATRLTALYDLLLGFINGDAAEGQQSVSTTYAASMHSEIDAVLTSIGIMITVSRTAIQRSQATSWLTEGTDYYADSAYLYIDPILVHSAYTRFKNNHEHQKPVIDTYHQFKKLIHEEPYFDGEMHHDAFATGRPVFRLRLDRMGEKGLDVSLFTTPDVLKSAMEF